MTNIVQSGAKSDAISDAKRGESLDKLFEMIKVLQLAKFELYDFIIQIDLYSVIDIPVMLNYLSSVSKSKFYGGNICDHTINDKTFRYCSGDMLILSRDLVMLLINSNPTDKLFTDLWSQPFDRSLNLISDVDELAQILLGYLLWQKADHNNVISNGHLNDKGKGKSSRTQNVNNSLSFCPHSLLGIKYLPGQVIRHRLVVEKNIFYYDFTHDSDNQRNVIYHRTLIWKLYNCEDNIQIRQRILDYHLSKSPVQDIEVILNTLPKSIKEYNSLAISGTRLHSIVWSILEYLIKHDFYGKLLLIDFKPQWYTNSFIRCARSYGIETICRMNDEENVLQKFDMIDKVDVLLYQHKKSLRFPCDIELNLSRWYNDSSTNRSIASNSIASNSIASNSIASNSIASNSIASSSLASSSLASNSIASSSMTTNVKISNVISATNSSSNANHNDSNDNVISYSAPKLSLSEISQLGQVSKLYTGPYYDHNEITLVTGLFDLSRREASRFRSIDSYLKLGQTLLSIPHNLIIFGDAHLVKEAWSTRCKLGLASKTFIYVFDLQHSPYYKYLPDITNKFNQHGQPNYYIPAKESPHYLIIGWTRFWLLQQLAVLNPFNTKAVLWVDYGIFHLYNEQEVKSGVLHLCKRIINCPIDKIRFMVLKHDDKSTFSNLDTYYSTRRWNLAAGLFSGSLSDIIWLGQQMDQLIIQCMQGIRPSLEELMLNIIYVQNRNRFEVYYGDYHQILCNHDRYRENFDIIKRNIDNCRQFNLWSQLLHLCRFLLAGDLPPTHTKYVLELMQSSAEHCSDLDVVTACKTQLKYHQ